MRETRRGLSFQIRIPNIPHKECSIRSEPEANRKIKCSRLLRQANLSSLLALWFIQRVCDSRRRRRRKGRPVVGCWSGARPMRLRPPFNMWFSSEKAVWRSVRFTVQIGIQCSINITHPLILSCFVCLVRLVPCELVLLCRCGVERFMSRDG